MQSDRRLHPRVNTDLPGEIELFGATYDVMVVNLSLGGFLVEGAGELVRLDPPGGLGAAEVDLHFGLEDSPIHCRCRVVYKRRHSYNQTSLGLHILSMSDQSSTAIRDFIDQQLAIY